MFYKDNVVLLDEKDDIFLIRTKKNKLFFDHYQREQEMIRKIIQEDYKDEFDVSYDYLGNISIIYKNIEHQLVLTTLSNKHENSIIIEELQNKIYYLNLIMTDVINIFYVEETNQRNVLNVVHLMLDGDKVIRNIVDRIEKFNIVNPIQIRQYRGNLIIFYYFKNVICLKILNEETKQWEEPITLTDNRNKLYLDTKIISDEIHLVYSVFNEEQFYINYEKFILNEDYIVKRKETKISSYGNHTEPLLIREGPLLYIVWKASNILLSTFSNDNGHTWEKITEFPQVKRLDVVKYKYLTKSNLQSREIDYSYGSTNPIKFVGF